MFSFRLTWSGLLPIARLVESTPAEWIHIPPEEIGAADLDVKIDASNTGTLPGGGRRDRVGIVVIGMTDITIYV